MQFVRSNFLCTQCKVAAANCHTCDIELSMCINALQALCNALRICCTYLLISVAHTWQFTVTHVAV